MMNQDAMRLSIGELARESGLSVKALRLYDQMGLLSPHEVDPHSGYRYYLPTQVPTAVLVARLRRIGMPLAQIAQLTAATKASASAAAAILTSFAREAAARSAAVDQEVARLVHDLAPDGAGEEHRLTTIPRQLAVRSEQGGRDAQLDAVHADGGLLAVADGFGDHPDPGSAVIDAVVAAGPTDLAGLDRAVAQAARVAGALPAGSGTTLTAVLVTEEELLVAHIGDARAYLVREDRLQLLTRDHSLVQSLVEEGRLSPEEARRDDRRPLLHRALAPEAGPAVTAPDLGVHRRLPGDRLVLATDGVHARLDAVTLADLLLAGGSPQQVADGVVDAVVAAGADDNLCIVVADL